MKIILTHSIYDSIKFNLKTELTAVLILLALFQLNANNDPLSLETGNTSCYKDLAIEKEPNTTAQQRAITGTITDQSGNVLPGASIVVKGTSIGVSSNYNGKYRINIPTNTKEIVVSFIGYQTQKITIGTKTNINVVLKENSNNLDEVLVVGYGSKDRKTVAGSVAQISGVVLENRPITNVIDGLQGALPGLTITRSSGRPGGEGYNINIRGQSSLNGGNSPLILIDGIEGNLELLDPNDIKSVSVLKDASASIYGTRASGGVLLIITKTGRKNQAPKITYSTNYSTNVIANLTERVNLRQWIELDWEAQTTGGGSPIFSATNATLEEALAKVDRGAEPEAFGNKEFLFYKEENWDKALFDNGEQKTHNISVRGGGERSDYSVALGYTRTDGILRDAWDSSERTNIRLNHGYELSDRLRLETKISYNKKRTLEGAFGARSIFTTRNKIFTWHPIFTQSGKSYTTQSGFSNPRQLANRDQGKRVTTEENFKGNFKLSYKLIDGLKIHTQVGINREFYNYNIFQAVSKRWNYDDTPAGHNRTENQLTITSGESTYKNLTAYLDYHKVIADKHSIAVMFGGSHEEKDYNAIAGQKRNFAQTEVLSLNLGNGEDFVGSSSSHWALKSLFSRFTYIYDSKYIAEAIFRRDGTSVFSPEKRWGNFGGVSLAWVASEEEFIKNLNIFDHLKLRASVGTTGNQSFDKNQLYDYIALIAIQNTGYHFANNTEVIAAYEKGIVSQSRTWENLKTTNFGVDYSFLNSKLSGSFDVYKKENKNMLLNVNTPAVIGGSTPKKNIGSLKTTGFEFSLKWADQVSNDFSYSISANLSDNTNLLVDYNGRDAISATREGYALNTYWGLSWDGIIQNQEELDEYKKIGNVPSNIGIGDARYKDINGDGKLSTFDDDGNDADIINLGNNQARYSYGFNLSAQYKGFDFSTFIQGVGKRTVFYSGNFATPFLEPWWQPLKRFYGNTWTPENTGAKYPKLTTASIKRWNYTRSENTRINAAYTRLKNITFGYSLSKSALQKTGLNSVRLYLSGENLFTISNTDGGYDPENTDSRDDFYPYTKRYSLGATLTF